MEHLLNEREAYTAMCIFLSGIWERTGSSDIAALLGDLRILEDGGPADPAVTRDFAQAIAAAKTSADEGSDFRPRSPLI